MASTSSELCVVTSFQHLPKNRILVWYAISRRSFFWNRNNPCPEPWRRSQKFMLVSLQKCTITPESENIYRYPEI
jgi:hypothetical protein